MPVSHPIWFCVADATRARIVALATPHGRLAQIKVIEQGEGYEHGRYEPPGRSQESATTARHSFTDAETPARREKRDFAKEVAAHLNQAAQNGEFARLVLAAPPKFLGDLRDGLTPKARQLVVTEIHKDLIKLPLDELQERLADHLAP